MQPYKESLLELLTVLSCTLQPRHAAVFSYEIMKGDVSVEFCSQRECDLHGMQVTRASVLLPPRRGADAAFMERGVSL